MKITRDLEREIYYIYKLIDFYMNNHFVDIEHQQAIEIAIEKMLKDAKKEENKEE